MTASFEDYGSVLSEDLASFREVVLSDRALRDRLKQHRDVQAFITEVVQAGRARGFRFEAIDVDRARSAALRAWIERRIPR